ncbi:MAG: ferrous iron transporter B, partial [Bacilli bacterium]|nr:ferrous iron transporter B [Bacilli bacterium]
MIKCALAGNPNCGKTTLFNSLTGATAHVGNWAGVTIDKLEGQYKKSHEIVNIVDLPGIYSLSPYTAEEVVTRNFIIDEKPDVIINVVDATNLERNLYLTTQLLEIDVPIIIALNMCDIVRKNGGVIKVDELSKVLGVPVIETSALKNEGLDILMEEAIKTSKKPRIGFTVLENKELYHLINDIKIAFKAMQVGNPLFHAVKFVELDELEIKNHEKLLPVVEEFKQTMEDSSFNYDFEVVIADARYKYIETNFSNIYIHPEIEHELVAEDTVEEASKKQHDSLSLSDKIDKVLTHRIWSFPIFIAIMFLMF